MSSPESISTESTCSSSSVGEQSSNDSQRYPISRACNLGGERGATRYSERRSSNPGPPTRYRRTSRSSSLNNELPPLPASEMSSESRRQNIVVMDRKRRLTESGHDTGRRRTITGRFMDREERQYDRSSSDGQHLSQPLRRPSSNSRPSEVIDLTSSPPSRQDHEVLSRQTVPSTENLRMYVLPKWQPDSEVSDCPICHRPFGFLFRRHHCRKCGRVVCNECSPHRITIPRQFIVQPPGTLPESAQQYHQITIDLTGEDNENETQSQTFSGVRRISNSALGGGEKVRLCNPCVPDPQPEPQSNYADPLSPQSRSLATFSSRSSNMPQRSDMLTFPPFSTENVHDRHPFSPRSYPAPPHPGTRVHFHEEDGQSMESSQDGLDSTRRSYLPTYAPNSRYPGYNMSHSRYHSFDMTRPPAPLPPPPSHLFGNRPRVRSMLDPFPHNPRIPPGLYPPSLHHSSLPSPVPRLPPPVRQTQLREEDICPICRDVLPAKGANGEETERENHIMQCITIHDASTSTRARDMPRSQSISQSQASVPASDAEMPTSSSFTQRAPMQMLRFTATEKDCIGEDGKTQECSICMIEYDVGDRLARLECWCKFHAECIAEWFGRKRECPVHKIG